MDVGPGLEPWASGSGFWVLGSGFWVLGSGFWVLGFGFWAGEWRMRCGGDRSGRKEAGWEEGPWTLAFTLDPEPLPSPGPWTLAFTLDPGPLHSPWTLDPCLHPGP